MFKHRVQNLPLNIDFLVQIFSSTCRSSWCSKRLIAYSGVLSLLECYLECTAARANFTLLLYGKAQVGSGHPSSAVYILSAYAAI